MSKFKTWVRRFIGVTLNGLGLVFFALLAVLDFAGTGVDWKDIVGEDKAKFIVPGVLLMNVFLRAFITKTKGHPSEPIIQST